MKKINISDAKCKSLSMLAPVQLSKDGEAGKFVIEAYTGAVVDRWYGKLAIEVNGMRSKNNIPILRDHDQGQIVGYAEKTWQDGSFFVSGKFSQVTDAAREVQALLKEGFPWQASIGVQPLKVVSLEDNAEMTINGKNLKGPAEVWLESEVFETSFLPCGADDNTSVAMFSRFNEVTAPAGLSESLARAEWSRDASLREEFDGDFESFEAYLKAEGAGKVRVCNGSKCSSYASDGRGGFKNV